jgi:hypothetical protein
LKLIAYSWAGFMLPGLPAFNNLSKQNGGGGVKPSSAM